MDLKYFYKLPKQSFVVLSKKHKIQTLFYWLTLIILPAFETLGLGVLALYVGILSNPEAIINKIPIQEVKNLIISLDFNDLILYVGILIIILFLIKNLLIILVNVFQLKLRKNIETEIAKKIFSKILNKPYSYHTSTNLSLITNEVISESNRVTNLIFGYNDLYKEIFLIMIIFIPLAIFNPLLFISIVLIFSLFSVLFFKKVKSRLILIGDKVKKHSELMLQSIKEVVENIVLIKLSNRNFFFINKYLNQFNLMNKYAISKRVFTMLPRMFFENGAVIAIVLIIFILFFSDLQSELVISYLSFISLASIRLVPAFTSLNVNFSHIVSSEKPFLDYVKNINYDFEKFLSLEKQSKKNLINLKSIETVELKNITFSYNINDDFVLKDVSIKFKKNTLTGIIGKSGSGKSTLSKLVMGLLEPTNGEVMINDVDINQVSHDWQKKIGYIPQDVFLIESSLIKNIALSQNDSEINIEKINFAIKNSLLEELVENSKEGLKFMINDNGKNISGGQKQRIGLARALYSYPDLLILDEPTSNLDLESQELLNRCLLEIKKDRIVILVTHSEKMLKNCDKIYKINEKKLSEINE